MSFIQGGGVAVAEKVYWNKIGYDTAMCSLSVRLVTAMGLVPVATAAEQKAKNAQR